MKNGKCLHWYGFARKVLIGLISLCRLCVLCVSVVVFPGNSFDHGGTENAEGAQRRRIILLRAKPLQPYLTIQNPAVSMIRRGAHTRILFGCCSVRTASRYQDLFEILS